MKNEKRRNFFSTMMLGLVALSSPLFARGRGRGRQNNETLTQEQLDELYFIYQEEKLARDVYITLGEAYPNENTFASIQLSEQRHIDSAQMLCDRYNIDLSRVNESEVGNFDLTVIQNYYDELVEKGLQSLPDALEVGVFIEELDINDLTHAIDDMAMPDVVLRVYGNLREGSYNHLEAFQTALNRI